MQFDSIAAALAMSGHGAYVWTVALVAVLTIAALLLAPIIAHRRLRAALRRTLEE